MFDFIHSLPESTPKILAALMLALLLLFSWKLPKEYILKGQSKEGRRYDLRIWASALLVLQSLLYLIF